MNNKFWIEEWKCNFPAAFLGNYDRPTDRSTNHIARDGHESCHRAFTFPISYFSIHTDITKFIGDLIAAKYWACFFYVISLTPFIYGGPSLYPTYLHSLPQIYVRVPSHTVGCLRIDNVFVSYVIAPFPFSFLFVPLSFLFLSSVPWNELRMTKTS